MFDPRSLWGQTYPQPNLLQTTLRGFNGGFRNETRRKQQHEQHLPSVIIRETTLRSRARTQSNQFFKD